MELLTGFIIGLFGSFHCIGMCGPIALALPTSGKHILGGRIIYNFGRILTYSLLGLLFGLLGNRLALFGLQQVLSISLGVVILISVFLPYKYKSKIMAGTGLNGFFGSLKAAFSRLFRNHSTSSLLAIGVLNGLLPCGFVYIGITGAIALGEASKGLLFMAMFGLGTVPVMLGASLAGGFVNLKLRTRLRKMVPAFTLLIAAIFILRGLNLGIPYLSPKLSEMNKTSQEQIMCH